MAVSSTVLLHCIPDPPDLGQPCVHANVAFLGHDTAVHLRAAPVAPLVIITVSCREMMTNFCAAGKRGAAVENALQPPAALFHRLASGPPPRLWQRRRQCSFFTGNTWYFTTK